MFSAEHRLTTLFILTSVTVGGPVMMLLDGYPLGEALYVGVPIGLGVGFLSAAAQWRRAVLGRRRKS